MRNVILRVADDQQESLLRHIVDTWHSREIATVHIPVVPEMLLQGDGYLDYVIREMHYKLSEMTRDRFVVSTALTWWRQPFMAIDMEVVPDRLLPVRNDIIAEARMLSNPGYWCMLLVLKGEALYLPPIPDLIPPSITWQTVVDCYEHLAATPIAETSTFGTARLASQLGPDQCQPDTSQPYPLDGLLSTIEELTQ